jgi:hypothetical protein
MFEEIKELKKTLENVELAMKDIDLPKKFM